MCCTNAVKNAIKIKEETPDKNVYVLYRDIRTYGFREIYFTKARELGVIFLRFDEETPPLVSNENGLSVTVKDEMLGADINIKTGLVALSMGIRPSPNSEKLSKIMKIPLDSLGFFLEAHMKLRPVEFSTDGIYLAGLAHFPKFIDETIAQACATVAKGAEAKIEPSQCQGCGICAAERPAKAIQLQHYTDEQMLAKCEGFILEQVK